MKDLTGQDHNRDGNICKIFVITQAGAEGISLSNVRQVHIMEPFWNNVRTEQVKGRAIRTCSHEDLPLDQRVVDIFTYVMKFSKEQMKLYVTETLLNMDKGISTDQQILQIAKAKEHLNNSLFNVMKASAIDCELFKKENGFNQACFRIGNTNESDMNYLYHPILESHLREPTIRTKS